MVIIQSIVSRINVLLSYPQNKTSKETPREFVPHPIRVLSFEVFYPCTIEFTLNLETPHP